MTPQTDVQLASSEDVRRGLERALGRLGLTLDQLRDQATRDEFVSEEARLTWFVIAPLAL